MISDTCARCGREDPEADDGDGEVIDGKYICSDCLTANERQAIEEDDMAFGDAMDVAFPNDVDAKAIGGIEFDMRIDLAHSLYHHEDETP